MVMPHVLLWRSQNNTDHVSIAIILSATLRKYCNALRFVKRCLSHLTVDTLLFGLVGQQYYSYWTGGTQVIVSASESWRC
jgi:hypothetical protein